MAIFGRRNRQEEPLHTMNDMQQPMQEPLHSMDEMQTGGVQLMPRGVALGGSFLPEYGMARTGPIGKEQIQEAQQTLQDYKAGKANLEDRIVQNEEWYKMQHWDQIRAKKSNPGDPEPASAWLLNSIANKHADAMDNYPEPIVLPREQRDEQDAALLSEILPVVLEQNEYEKTYSNMWWYKLKTGTGVTGVFWDPKKDNGIGDIDVRELDLLNLFWEPGITDIQKSRNFFHVALIDRDIISQQYPEVKDALTAPTIDITQYIYEDTVDTSDKVAVIDWYYKVSRNGRDVLHYCKFCNGEVLYASENDPQYADRGYYDHGKYPFVFDTLFPEAGSPAGFGYIDICKSPQLYIDKLDQVILKHAVMGARPRFFVRGDGKINEEEYADWTKDFVHYSGSADPRENIMPLEIPPLSDIYATVRNLKIEELKETSGNRDFSQGGTTAGVTAASAIAALQEAGSKLSRDMLKSCYRAFAQVNYLCIELMRQFYQEDRWFRVVGEQGKNKYVMFNNRNIAAYPQGNDFGMQLGMRIPIFDVKVVSQKSSPYSTLVQNERAKELYGMGFFRPDLADQALAALEMMQFEGIDKVRERISQNGTMFQQIQQMQQQMMQMAAIIDSLKGTTITQNMGAAFAQEGAAMNSAQPVSGGNPEIRQNSIGEGFKATGRNVGAARARAVSAATPN